MHSDLLKSGFVPNEDKSQWEPTQIITWLGVIINTIDGFIKATDERIAKLCHDLDSWFSLEYPSRVHVKRVANIAGQIISLSSCLGPVARIMTRFLFSVINSAVSWNCEVLLTQDAISEIDSFTPSMAKYIGGLSLSLPKLVFLMRLSLLVVLSSNCNRKLNWSVIRTGRSRRAREVRHGGSLRPYARLRSIFQLSIGL